MFGALAARGQPVVQLLGAVAVAVGAMAAVRCALRPLVDRACAREL